ncbi:MAG: class III signal peptide-containing protein [Bdellovibrionales bacterium]|nr:class III signal peptide-containing protein [Bdellovibrionales bacterium]
MLKQFLREEEGQSTVEYLLIIAVVVVVVTAMGNKIKPAIETLTTTIFSKINKQVSTLMGGV